MPPTTRHRPATEAGPRDLGVAVKISIGLTNYSWPDGPAHLGSHLLDLARRVDEGGIDTLWIADHLLQMDPTATIDEPMLEAYTTLGFLAAATSHVKLGTMVTWASIRPPALVVKIVTTLDVLSGGRAWLGVGAGYRGDEAAMTGLPFPDTAERFVLMEELVRLAAHMWDGDRGPFDGPRHRLEQPICNPEPISRPRVLIGGMGESRTLPLVARYGDACNLFDIPDGGTTLRRKLDVLARACDAVGRDVRDIEITLSSRLAPDETSAAFADRCGQLAQLGVQHVVLVTTGPWSHDELGVIFDAVEPVRALD
jgi:alkanesulfonate monooxygenase SsuD/methylene tetrahydromethanopterin reductase-like flavin-dependent oxidoreductase (luciferase family)